VSVTLPAIPVTEGRGAVTERVAVAGGCNGGRGQRWLAAATEGGEAAASGGCDEKRGRPRRLAAAMEERRLPRRQAAAIEEMGLRRGRAAAAALMAWR
jgi:hypothetical protein